MRLPRTLLVLLSLCPALLGAAPAPLSSPEEPRYDIDRYWWQPIFHRGEHFRVVAHFPWDGLLESAAETAEAAWPLAASIYGGDESRPKRPYNVHLFRDRVLFDRACLALTGTRWPNNNGLTDRESGVSLVLLGAGLADDPFLQTIGLSLSDRLLIAHEATHLYSTYRVPGDALHPSWLSEGLAQHVARKVVVQGGWAPSLEEDPNRGRSLLHLQDLMTRGLLPSADSILREAHPSIDPYHRYGLYENFVAFLVDSRGSDLRACIRTAGELKEAEEARRQLAELLIGAENGLALDNGFRSHLTQQRATWRQLGGSLTLGEDGWSLAARDFERGLVWSADSIEEEQYALGGRLCIPEGTRRQRFHFLFAREGERHLRLTFDTEAGLSLALTEGIVRTELAKRPGLCQPGSELDFQVRIEGQTVRVRIGEQEVLRFEFPGTQGELQGEWGMSTDLGCWADWKGIGRS